MTFGSPRRAHAGGARRGLAALIAAAGLIGISGLTAAGPARAGVPAPGTYTNPLDVESEVGPVENCADPTVLRGGTAGDPAWYMYCTKDPRNDQDRDTNGDYVFQRIPTYRSLDLVNWTYEGNVFDDENYPDWVEPDAGLFAPEIRYMNGQYYLYYTATNTTDAFSPADGCDSDGAIGVATSDSPIGPWTDSGDAVVDPRQNGDGCNFFWTFDPEIVTTGGQRYIFFGSYYGGVFVRELSFDGLESDPDAETRITPGNKFEAPEVIRHGGYYYMFLSAANCCNGPLTGYSVFAGRSVSLTGPYFDRDGNSLLEFDTDDSDPSTGRIGGTPVLTLNGNRWVGPGHNTVFRDYDGQWWTIYHAVLRNDPYFADEPGFTKRPALLDPVDWIDGWPTVRAGRWASSTPMPAPAAQPGQETSYVPQGPWRSRPGDKVEALSDEFDGALGSQWTWIREPEDSASYGVEDGKFRFDAQKADLFGGSNNASILVEDAPDGEYVVQARVRLTVPPEGCCSVFTQTGLVIYGDDDQYLKLVHVSIFETRQTEFAKEVASPPPGYPFYGNTIVGPPGEWTTLRVVKVIYNGSEYYQAWTKRDAQPWIRGGTWRYDLGAGVKIGLVSMGEPGDQEFTSYIDWVRVYELDIRRPAPPGSF